MSHDGIGEVTEALTGLVSDFKCFRDEIETKMKQQEQRMTMTRKMNRPHLSQAVEAEAPHQKAMDAYLRSGDEGGLRSLVLEGKGMTTVDGDGGYLLDPQTTETVQSVLHGGGSIRSIANVVNVEATSFDVLVDRAELESDWINEESNVTDTKTPKFERVSIPLHELAAMPKASQRLLDDAAFDLEGWLAGRIAQRFANAEAEAFVTGNGNNQPKGFLKYETSKEAGWSWGKLEFVPSGAANDFASSDPADAIINLVYALGAQYRANATFVMNSKTAGAVRKMKDSDGRFLWADSLASGQPSQLMGYPVLIAEAMEDVASNNHPIAFGDFRAGYTIAERRDLRILRDPFSAKPHVLFYATKRVGGDVTDFAAIKVLRFAA
jgi:HK97 family phage major capsid protein